MEKTLTTVKVTKEMFDELSREEQLLAIAKASLEQYGTIIPDADQLFMALGWKRCHGCDETKKILPDFGVTRYPSGALGPQGYCAQCRANRSRKPAAERREAKLKKLGLL